MHRFFARRRLITRFIIGFSLVLFATIATLAFVFSQIYSEVLFDAITLEHRDRLNQVVAHFERLHEDMINGYLSIATSRPATRFFHSSEPSPSDELALRRDIRRFLYTRSEIHSISVYGRRSDYLVSTAVRNSTPQAEREVRFMAGVDEPFTVHLRRIEPNRAGRSTEPVNVVTYAFRVPFRAGDDPSDMVVINLLDPLRQEGRFAAEPNEQSSTMVLMAPDGRVLSPATVSAEHGELVEQIYHYLYTSDSAESSGTLTITVAGAPTAISFARSSGSPDFYVVSAHDLHHIVEVIRDRRNHVLRIAAVIFVVGGVAALLLLRRIYRPISRMIGRISRQLGSDAKTMRQRHDLEVVLESFSDTIREMKVLEELNRSHVEHIRQSYLHELIVDPEAADAPSTAVEVDHSSSLRVCELAIDEFSRVKPSSRSYFTEWLRLAAFKHFADGATVDVVSAGEGRVAVFLWGDLAVAEVEKPSYWADLQERCRGELNHSLTVGIGRRVAGLDRARSSYLVAHGCVETRFTRGLGRLIAEAVVETEANNTRPYPESVEERVVRCIRVGDRAELRDLLETLRSYIADCRYDNARHICETIYLVCAKTLFAFSANTNVEGYSFGNSLRSIDSYRQFVRAVESVYDEFHRQSARLSELRDAEQTSELIERAAAYIREHLGDPSLSVESLADLFGYSSGYFGRMFKQVTGVGLNDYIRSMRIERAKQMLMESDESAQEIAAKSGFGNEKYFHYVFKRETGLTPRTFRIRDGGSEAVAAGANDPSANDDRSGGEGEAGDHGRE